MVATAALAVNKVVSNISICEHVALSVNKVVSIGNVSENRQNRNSKSDVSVLLGKGPE